MHSALAAIAPAIAPLLARLLLADPSPQALWSSADASAVAPSGSEAERERKAREHFERGRYQEAAQEFETLADAGGAKATQHRFNAAAARVALRHHAHAAAHLGRVLADPSLPGPQRAQALALLAGVQRDLVAIPMIFELPRDVDSAIAVRAEYLPVYASDRRPALAQTMPRDPAKKYRRETTMRLDAGAWQLRVDDPRFTPVTRRIEVPRDAARVTWELQPLQDRRRARKFAAGFAGGGGVLAIVGLGVLAGGQARWSRTLALPVESCADDDGVYPIASCRAALGRAGSLRDVGAGLLGVGLGGTVAGLTALIKAPRRRRDAWIAGAVLGAVSVFGGAIVAQRGRSTFQAVNSDSRDLLAWTDPDYIDGSSRGGRQALLGAAWASLGGGLLLGSITGLLADRAGRFHVRDGDRKVSIGGHISPGRAVLTASGWF